MLVLSIPCCIPATQVRRREKMHADVGARVARAERCEEAVTFSPSAVSNVESHSQNTMQLLRRTLILVHRYLGIPLSLLFVLWFVTGIAMMYVGGMPALDPTARLERLPSLDLAAVRLTPAEAAAKAERG